jgi:hypothetical protein
MTSRHSLVTRPADDGSQGATRLTHIGILERVDTSLVSTQVNRGYREKVLQFFQHGGDAVYGCIEMH